MTPAEFALARSILKLSRKSVVANRNRVSFAYNSPHRDIWANMEKNGDAVEIKRSGPHGSDNYLLCIYAVTKQGALKVVQEGERIPEQIFDPEWAPIIDNGGLAIARTERGRGRLAKGVHFDKFMHAVYELVTTEDELTVRMGYRQGASWRYWAETGVVQARAAATLDNLMAMHRAGILASTSRSAGQKPTQTLVHASEKPTGEDLKDVPAQTVPTLILPETPRLFVDHYKTRPPAEPEKPVVVMIKPGERFASLKSILEATGFEFTAVAL